MINTGGAVAEKIIDQHAGQDGWQSLGYYQLSTGASVQLANITSDTSTGKKDVAFDAMAFVPVAGTIVTHTVDTVAIFNENQDLNTNTPWLANTPIRTMTTLRDWATQYLNGGPVWNDPSSYYPNGVLTYPNCVGSNPSACIRPALRQAAQAWFADVAAAGNQPVQHPPGQSQATWMAFANAQPPTTVTSSTFANDESYKQKSRVTVSFVQQNGVVVPGSQSTFYENRTGDTHVPAFLLNFFYAMRDDYGIALADLTYDATNLNAYDSEVKHVDPFATGIIPGRAYTYHNNQPDVTPSGNCVNVKSITGGVIAWRVTAAQAAVQSSVDAWVTRVQNQVTSLNLPPVIGNLATELKNMFFNGNDSVAGTLFKHAPPIWQQLNAQVCVDGKVKTTMTGGNDRYHTVAEESFMPDFWIYYDGAAVTADGTASASGPVQNGDFQNFSNAPAGTFNDNPYGFCGFNERGHGGNPWGLGFFDSAGVEFNSVTTCNDGSIWVQDW